jgi:hypothetical protein
MKRTLYQILGVEKDATAEAIAAGYRARLAAAQAAPGGDATAVMPQRAAYDASLVAPVPTGVARAGVQSRLKTRNRAEPG